MALSRVYFRFVGWAEKQKLSSFYHLCKRCSVNLDNPDAVLCRGASTGEDSPPPSCSISVCLEQSLLTITLELPASAVSLGKVRTPI